MIEQTHIKISKIIDKINILKNNIDKIIFVIAIVTTIIYKFRHTIKNLLLFINIDANYVDAISKKGIYFCKYIINVIVAYVCLIIIYILIREFIIFLYRKNQKNRFLQFISNIRQDKELKELYKNLYNYFSDKKNITPIFISGEWGAGKTYTIEKFLEDYYKYSKQKIYKISCFGITTKEVLMKRISEACENEDTSFRNQIVSIIEEIPIVGVFLKNILEKKYDINNIKENSIFIFDNFERIECAEYDGPGNSKGNNYQNAIVKYDIVAGIIDELIEKYNMKVIIIGNEREMAPKYALNTFICKLGCKKYSIIPDEKVFEKIWLELLEKMITKISNRTLLLKVLNEVKDSSLIIWKMSFNQNIRILYKAIYNYFSFIVLLSENKYKFNEDINEIISIYYTNLIINLFNSRNLEFFSLYESIGLHFEKEMVINNKKIYEALSNINAMWCSNKEINDKWMNLEQYYYEIIKHLEIIKVNALKYYISRNNYCDNNLKVEKIKLNDFIFLLKYGKIDFYNNANKLLKNNAVIINDLDDIPRIIDDYKLEDILNDNNELLVNLFDYIYKKDKNMRTSYYRDRYNSFAKLDNKYKQLIK